MGTILNRRDFCAGAAAMVVVGVSVDGFSAMPSDPKKRKLGQFFTEKRCWMLPQVRQFIADSECGTVYDPFAGSGCLINAVLQEIPSVTASRGLDIDAALGWEQNDSLMNIPPVKGAIIVTNPPYISNYSASRKKIGDDLQKYFKATDYDDVYLLALDRMLDAQENVVAIIPETFINSPYRRKDRLKSITILEENPFEDTDAPVVVVCFDSRAKKLDEIAVYKNAEYVCTLGEVERCRLTPNNTVAMKFNDPDGWLAVRCVDTTNPDDRIRFAFKQDIDYDWARGIKVSSRLLTLIELEIAHDKRAALIAECNRILAELREKSHDIILSPFKGNMKNGVRRRRLDFQTCRAIVERACFAVAGELAQDGMKQLDLFEARSA